jgi:hypothetical protein
MKPIDFYKKYIDPFTAVAVLIMVCILVFQLVNYNNLQKEIAENCGWELEDTRCYCEKSSVLNWENQKMGELPDFNLSLTEGETNG